MEASSLSRTVYIVCVRQSFIVSNLSSFLFACHHVQERDGMRAILDSYDSELSPSEHTPQLTCRLREAEEMLQKVHGHNAEMEVIRF